MRILLFLTLPKEAHLLSPIAILQKKKKDTHLISDISADPFPFHLRTRRSPLQVSSWRTCGSIASTTLIIHNYEPLGPGEATAIPIGSLRKRRGHCTGRHAAPGSSIALLAYYNAVHTSGSRCSAHNPMEVCLL